MLRKIAWLRGVRGIRNLMLDKEDKKNMSNTVLKKLIAQYVELLSKLPEEKAMVNVVVTSGLVNIKGELIKDNDIKNLSYLLIDNKGDTLEVD
jgi:hypothetical protein